MSVARDEARMDDETSAAHGRDLHAYIRMRGEHDFAALMRQPLDDTSEARVPLRNRVHALAAASAALSTRDDPLCRVATRVLDDFGSGAGIDDEEDMDDDDDGVDENNNNAKHGEMDSEDKELMELDEREMRIMDVDKRGRSSSHRFFQPDHAKWQAISERLSDMHTDDATSTAYLHHYTLVVKLHACNQVS